jgi:uncharacterized membrane protein
MEEMTITDNGGPQLSLERLKALSDGVFAIVITILVLELEVPETHDFSESGLLAFLLKIEHQLLPYIASFALTAGYWVLHHVMLDSISRCDRYFLWLNLLFMLPLSLAPFVTGMRAEYPGEISVSAIFGAVQLANFLMLLVIWRYGVRHLTASPVPAKVVRGMYVRLFMAMALNIIGVLLVPVSERLVTVTFLCTPFLFVSHKDVDSASL